MKIRLNRTNWNKLKELIRKRDSDLRFEYIRILGIPFPHGETEVHHVLPRGEGGEDVSDNLITLDAWVHRTKFHTTMGHADPEWARLAKEYLESEAVIAWTLKHGDELKKIYATAEPSRIERTRKQCVPKKPAWQPF